MLTSPDRQGNRPLLMSQFGSIGKCRLDVFSS